MGLNCLPVTLIVQKAPGSVLLKLNPLSENDISGTTRLGAARSLQVIAPLLLTSFGQGTVAITLDQLDERMQ